MPLNEGELEVSRRRPAYRTAIGLYRAMLAALLLLLVLLYSDLVRNVPSAVCLGIASANVSAAMLVEWVGARTLDAGDNFWSLRRAVLKDVFGLGRRYPERTQE